MEILFNWIASAFSHSYFYGLFSVGVSLSLATTAFFIVYHIGLCLWCFVEDKKVGETGWFNKTTEIEHEINEWEYAGRFYKETRHESFAGVVWLGAVSVFLLGGILLGATIQAIAWQPIFFSVLFSGVGLLFLARGVRRLQKKLNKHILDKEAHKEQEE